MKDTDELMELIEKHLSDGLDELWDSLTPEERGLVFRGSPVTASLIEDYVDVTY